MCNLHETTNLVTLIMGHILCASTKKSYKVEKFHIKRIFNFKLFSEKNPMKMLNECQKFNLLYQLS